MSNRPANVAEFCSYCKSKETELRRRKIAGGSFQYAHQCLACGRMRSTAVKVSTIRNPDRLPAWDEERVAEHQEFVDGVQRAERETDHEAWLIEHNEYLASPAWRRLRKLVLFRAHGKCEGCGTNDATQVHHRSYKHWKQEFLWELVAICDDCHERVHSDQEGP